MTAEDLPTDEEFIGRARRGDARAFEALCLRYEDLLRARARKWIVGALQRKVSLLDVRQETCFAAHQRLEDFEDRGQGALGAWHRPPAEMEIAAQVESRVPWRLEDGRRVKLGKEAEPRL